MQAASVSDGYAALREKGEERMPKHKAALHKIQKA